MNYLRRLLKTTIYRSILNRKGNFNYFGTKVYFPKNSSTFNVAIRDGIYEHDILRFILNHVTEDSTYFDIGANIGLMSVPVLSRFQGVKVISVEASPNTFAYLKKTHDTSSYNERWTIINKAVKENEEDIELFTASGADGAFESIRDTKRVIFNARVKVKGTTIDKIWEESGRPAVTVIKCDIEGADLLALQGAVKCLASENPVVIAEWNKVNIQPFGFIHEDLIKFCRENKYVCYALPSLINVMNATELSLHTIITENFILMPAEKTFI